MRIDTVHLKGKFKNLENFKIEFDENSMETVLLGLNATGKSNFMEAIVIIFRDLDLERSPILEKKDQTLNYYIKYNCRNRKIEIEYSNKTDYIFHINGEKLRSKSQFYKNKDEYLPSHIFVYYSGLSERLKSLYADHKLLQFKKMMKHDMKYEDFNEMPRIFLVEPIHASFALIAFYLFKDREKETIDFLNNELGIVDFGSSLFMLKQAKWSLSRKGEDRFWNTTGLVRRFVEDLWNFSTAPMFFKESIKGSLNKRESINRLFLYIKDKETFSSLVDMKMYHNKIPLFNALCSLHYSELIDDQDVKIKIVKKNIGGELAMGELSEGEKQLITVLGLLKFTKDDEALILLDEPDTHLNPLWKWKYLDFIDKVVKRPEKTQIIFCTHDPLVIGSMEKNQVRIFQKKNTGTTNVIEPDISPRGLGVAGILTSNLFGLSTTIDKPTNELLEERNYLLYKESKGDLLLEDQNRLKELFEILSNKGFNHIFKDPEFSKYIVDRITKQNKNK